MLVPGVEIPHLCFQCEDYPCIEACTTEALKIDDKTGAVIVDDTKCISCGLCIDACPGDVPHLHPEKNTIIICDLCNGSPKCVEACQKGKWKTLKLIPKSKSIDRKSLAKDPKELTIKVAQQILGENITKEVLSP